MNQLTHLVELLDDRLKSIETRINTLESNQYPIIKIKTDTGDFATGVSGTIVINTFDNTVKIYAEGAWREMVTSW